MALINSPVELSDLDGDNGFRLVGENDEDIAARSVSSAGDVNNDGFADLLIGAPDADDNGLFSGNVYLVYGRANFPASFDLANLNGTNGVKIKGEFEFDTFGRLVVAAGDVNNDGIDDIAIGSRRSDVNGADAGGAFVIFGNENGIANNLDVSALDGADGFRINGVAAGDFASTGLGSAGDINGDGIDDLVIGSINADVTGDNAGAAYVVFGKTGDFSPTVELSSLNGNTGFRLLGEAADDLAGTSVSSAGDINGDGRMDLLIGASKSDANGQNSGAAYVVYGASAFAADLNLSALNGGIGFKITGAAAGDFMGRSVSLVGDMNGDGVDDIVIGADQTDANGANSGAAYVIFGNSDGFDATLDVSALDGSDGFLIKGAAAGDLAGFTVSGAGDVNNDGLMDLIIGAQNAAPNGAGSGAAYVVYGREDGFAPELDLSALNGPNGFQIFGEDENDAAGVGVSAAGDVNNDGIDDVIVGAFRANSGSDAPGAAYVIFGSADSIRGTDGPNTLTGTARSDNMFGLGGKDKIEGKGGDDLIDGGAGKDRAVFTGSKNVTVDLGISGAQNTGYGNDRLVSIESVVSGGGNDTLSGDGGANDLFGNGGRDDLTGKSGNDRLFGGQGNDTLTGGGGNDNLIGGNGSDTAFFANNTNAEVDLKITARQDTGYGRDKLEGIENITSGGGRDTLKGDGGDNRLSAGGGNDTLEGRDGNDRLLGGGGNDRMAAGLGDDLIDGGRGTDTAIFGGKDGVSVDLQINNAQDTGYGNDRLVSIENIESSSGRDTLKGNTGSNTLKSGGGNDRVEGRGGNDTLLGGGGNDRLAGGLGNDVMNGGAGADTAEFSGQASATVDLRVGGRQDTGYGNDRLISIENLTGGNGGDTLSGNSGANVLTGGNGGDTLLGRDGNDRLLGGNGNDTLIGASGNDVLNGGKGRDTAVFDGGFDATVDLSVNGTQNTGYGNDRLISIENLTGGNGNDKLTGHGAANTLNGGAGNDQLNGEAGGDRLIGGAGQDTLTGGAGNDRMTGGDGNDTFVFNSTSGNDRITDFEDGFDVMNLKDAGATEFSDLTITSQGADVLIEYVSISILLEDTLIGTVETSDFIFDVQGPR